jgi:hypothetical protein
VKRGAPLKRREPLRTSREKRTGRRDTGPDRSVKAIVDERDDWTCACCGNSVYGRPFSRQHRVARGMGGTSLKWKNRAGNIVLLCGSATSPGGCHLACEQRDERMHELGFWLEQSQRPWLEPIAHAVHGWVYLLDDGTVMDAETGGAE